MKLKILDLLNTVLLVLSLIGFIYLFSSNFDYFKINIKKIEHLYFFVLIILSTTNSFLSNYLFYFISKTFHKLTFHKFTTINLISNLSNELIPFFGTFYKGFILKKYNFSYSNYFYVLLFLKIAHYYLKLILILFSILFFEQNIFVYLIVFTIFLFQYYFFIYFKTLNLKNKFIKKFLKKFKPYLFLLKNKKKEIFTYLFGIRFIDFLIFYILIQSIATFDLKSISIFYILRIIINGLPFITGSLTKLLIITFTFSFMDLSLQESFFLNFFHTIFVNFGLIFYLLINSYFKKLKY